MLDEDALFEMGDLYRADPEPQTKAQRLRKMARQSDPQTSWEAALAQLPTLTKTKQRLLDLVSRHPEGCTSSEVARALDMDKGTSSKRLGDLEREGYLYTDGTRDSDRNRKSSIYKRTRS